MQKIKLLQITTVPMSLHKLMKGQPQFFQQNNFEVFLASAQGKEIQDIEKETGIKVNTLPLTRKVSPFVDLIAIWKTYKLIKKIKPDIVHSITPKAGMVSMIAACLAKTPVRMHTFTGLIFPSKKGLFKKILIYIDKLICFCATHVYPEGSGVRKDMMNYKITNKPLKVLANGNINGIDLSYYNSQLFTQSQNEELRKKLQINSKDFVFTFIGRLVSDKGINELITAFTNLQQKYANIKLLLVGTEEPELDPLQAQTREEIHKNPNIITTGWVDDVRPYLAISDLFVFPSYREGMPNVVIQAGAMGLTSIVTDINGSNEIIIHNKNGLIVPVKDIKALETAMKLLLTDHQLRQNLTARSRELIKKRFDQKFVWQALLKEYQQLYKNAYQ